MFENKEEAIANALVIQKGTYVFYRDLGMNLVDEAVVPTRRDITVLLAKYYPEVSVKSIELSSEVSTNGHRVYRVNLGD